MKDLTEKWKNQEKEYSELIFSTKSGFKLGFYQQGTKLTLFSSTSGYGAQKFYPTSSSVLDEIKKNIDETYALLLEK